MSDPEDYDHEVSALEYSQYAERVAGNIKDSEQKYAVMAIIGALGGINKAMRDQTDMIEKQNKVLFNIYDLLLKRGLK